MIRIHEKWLSIGQFLVAVICLTVSIVSGSVGSNSSTSSTLAAEQRSISSSASTVLKTINRSFEKNGISKKQQKSMSPSYYKFYYYPESRDDHSFGQSYGAPSPSHPGPSYGSDPTSNYGGPGLSGPAPAPHFNSPSLPTFDQPNYGGLPFPPEPPISVLTQGIGHETGGAGHGPDFSSSYGAGPPVTGHGHSSGHFGGAGDIGPPVSGHGHSSGHFRGAGDISSNYAVPAIPSSGGSLTSSYSAPPMSYSAPMYGAPMPGYGVPSQMQYGSEVGDDGGKSGKGILGLLGLLGLKGLLPKAFSLFTTFLPVILLLALPLLLPALAPLLIGGLVLLAVLALGLLFLPVPVITIPGGRLIAETREEISTAIYNAIYDDQCIEKISCEITHQVKTYGISSDPIKKFISSKEGALSLTNWTGRIVKGIDSHEDCKKFSCSWNSKKKEDKSETSTLNTVQLNL